jgi:hypothetical protein
MNCATFLFITFVFPFAQSFSFPTKAFMFFLNLLREKEERKKHLKPLNLHKSCFALKQS